MSGTLATPSSATHVAWDHLRGDGLSLDARGAVERGAETLGWDADVVRGARGVLATTDLDAAARPFDRAAVDASWRDGGWTFGTSLGAIAPRGGGLLAPEAVAPVATLRRGEGLGGAGAYDVVAEVGGAHRAGEDGELRAGGRRGRCWRIAGGAVGASLALRAAGDVVEDGEDVRPLAHGGDGAVSARGRPALPFGRAFAPAETNDPWVHRLEPVPGGGRARRAWGMICSASCRGEVAPRRPLGSGELLFAPAGAVRGEAWVADAALASEQGRWGARIGSDVSLAGGLVGALDGTAPRVVTRGHAALTSTALGLTAEGARVAERRRRGGALLGRVRFGETTGPTLTLLAAERDGIDPVLARALTDAPLEPSGGFLASSGWTVGGRARVPWTAWLATTAGGDVDLSAGVLVAARGGVELRDRCGCVRVRATGAHRIGRDGVDACDRGAGAALRRPLTQRSARTGGFAFAESPQSRSTR